MAESDRSCSVLFSPGKINNQYITFENTRELFTHWIFGDSTARENVKETWTLNL